MSDDISLTDNKSQFFSAAEQKRQQLGPARCYAKWKQVSLHLTTGMTNSCYHPPLHEIDAGLLESNPSALHNTPHKKEQRRIMLRNERPAECQYCWNMEDLGELSDRHYRSGEPWAAIDLDQLTGDEDVIPSYVEVNFSNVCNLACSYCSPQFSSTWMDDANRHGAYSTSNLHNDPAYFQGRRRPIPVREHNPYLDAFWSWWPTLYPKLRHFRMTGGEPLLDKNTYRVFDYVLAAPHPELHLNVTSNFSVPGEIFNRYLDYVKRLSASNIEHFMQYVSLDTGDWEQAAYIRRGLIPSQFMVNVNQYLEEVPNRNSLTFIVTLNNLSVSGLDQLLDYILELRSRYSHTYQRVWFDTPVLRNPSWQSLQILPESYQHRMQQHIDFMRQNLMPDNSFVGFKDYEIQRMERALAWMSEPQDSERLKRDRADFYRFFNEYDQRSYQQFLKVFPEMKSFWQECESYARQS
jgi:MoaA/NifB/PqqE/SkfB family radical SAM enzyme